MNPKTDPHHQSFTSDVVIGLEIHIGLQTQTKLFCSCVNKGSSVTDEETVDEFGFKQDTEKPNTYCCPVCLGHPGAKPVCNETVINYAVKLAKALDCSIAKSVVFSRKTYFYPDLAKNYQITQYEEPLGKGGRFEYDTDSAVRLTRIHVEEDPASIVHEQGLSGSAQSLIDYNRSGTPLCELVTEPELHTPQQARDFLRSLVTFLGYLDIFDTKNGLLKADANISIKESGYTRVEIKNINGLREIERALTAELDRQRKAVERGETLVQETRAWDADAGQTLSLRKKETEDDYGYIFDTDLTPIPLTDEYITGIAETIPVLPIQRMKRYITELGLSAENAKTIIATREIADLFETMIQSYDSTLITRWIKNQFVRYTDTLVQALKQPETKQDVVAYCTAFFSLLAKKRINDQTAKEVLEKTIETLSSPETYVQEHNLEIVNDEDELKIICSEEIANNPSVIADYNTGHTEAINYIVGQVMKRTKGKADPVTVKQMISSIINSE